MDLSRFNHGEGDYQQAPIGTHNAVCVAVIDIGTQHKSYQGQEKDTPQIVIRWEIDELMSDGRRFAVQAWYTASMNEKAKLRAHLEAWRGQPFNEKDFAPDGFALNKLLGAPCMLNVQHTENGKAKIAGVMKLPKGIKPLKPETEPFLFDLQNYDPDLFENAVGKGMQTQIKKSPEWAKVAGNGAAAILARDDFSADLDDEIPF